MNPPALKMVAFDFDGVIADTEKAHFEMFRLALLEEGIEFTWSQYCEKYLGYTDLECIQHVLIDRDRLNPPLPTTESPEANPDIQRIFQSKKTKYAAYIAENSLLLPGVRDLLDDLRKNRIVAAICSGALTEEIEFILEKEQIHPYFTFIVAAEDVSLGKPDPEGYRLCLQRLNEQLPSNTHPGPLDSCPDPADPPRPVQPTECIVIEDSLWGIQAAHAAGMKCLALTTSYPADQLSPADRIVADLSQVNTDLLREMIA